MNTSSTDQTRLQALIAEARAQRDEAVEASDGWQALYVAASAKLTSIEALLPDVLILLDAMATTMRDDYARVIVADLRRVLQEGQRLVRVEVPLSLAGWPSPICTCPGPYTKDLDCPVHGDGR